MLTVVAALIESGGKLLVCQRRRGDSFALQWEFPGGKVRPGEPPAQALARELEEELGIEARIGREIYRTEHRYAELAEPIELIFFSATIETGEPQNLAFEQFAWRASHSLPELNFLPADRELIEKLSTGALRIS
ncbi:MAG TPA: (deoxy)nucleoside triphosphate pyrophosphohydrolase [Candidatus Sulfotelmatobacter sp.]|nr:(deoxy)nucleoside triphosphate pyrophosphohydrolase [Candidatus Sulfotelmatobacter sp.]